jgi:hypothetical protein
MFAQTVNRTKMFHVKHFGTIGEKSDIAGGPAHACSPRAYGAGGEAAKNSAPASSVVVSRKIAPLGAIKGTDDDSHLSRDKFRSSNRTT